MQGPITGPAASLLASKAERVGLPANALLPSSAPALLDAPRPTATLHPAEEMAYGSAHAPGPAASHKRAQPPGLSQLPGRARPPAAAPSAGQHTLAFPQPAPALVPSAGSAVPPSGQPDAKAASGASLAIVPAAQRLPAPSVAPAKGPSSYLVAWARQTDGQGPLVKSQSVALPPGHGMHAPAPAPSLAAARMAATAPSPVVNAASIVAASVTATAAAPVAPKRTAILYTGDGN